jgi:hypothetical protein
MAGQHEFRDMIRKVSLGTEQMFATIPGEVNHRLKIVTTLASAWHEHRPDIMKALQLFNCAFSSRRNWKASGGDSSRETTLAHAR